MEIVNVLDMNKVFFYQMVTIILLLSEPMLLSYCAVFSYDKKKTFKNNYCIFSLIYLQTCIFFTKYLLN